MAMLIKTQDAQPLGAYIPTSLDARKAEADFRLVALRCIVWRTGETQFVTARELKKLQAARTWEADF